MNNGLYLREKHEKGRRKRPRSLAVLEAAREEEYAKWVLAPVYVKESEERRLHSHGIHREAKSLRFCPFADMFDKLNHR